MQARAWSLIFLAGFAIAFAGCGGGESSNVAATSASELTKAQLIAKADAICERTNEDTQEGIYELEEDTGSTNLTRRQEMVQVILPEVHREAEDLDRLTPPSDFAERYQAAIDAMLAGTEEGERDPATVLDGSSTEFSTAFKIFNAYGFKVCGIG